MVFDAVMLRSAMASPTGQADAMDACRSGSTISRRTSRSSNHAQPDLFPKEPYTAAGAASADPILGAGNGGASARAEHGAAAFGSAAMASSELRYADASAPPKRAPHLLDVRAAAAWLGLSKSTLDKMRCYGEGPRFIRATGRAVRYDPADLAAFAEGRRRSRTTDELPA
jgi:predicted DNA-binding transcriptional regulator AlpA